MSGLLGILGNRTYLHLFMAQVISRIVQGLRPDRKLFRTTKGASLDRRKLVGGNG